MGMRATASHDFVIRDCFVPGTRAFSDWSRVTAERSAVATPPASLSALMVGSVLLGVAGSALEIARGLLGEPSRAQRLRRGQTAYALAEIAGSLQAARHFLHQAARQPGNTALCRPAGCGSSGCCERSHHRRPGRLCHV